jgi:RNA-directed DNA polymerase
VRLCLDDRLNTPRADFERLEAILTNSVRRGPADWSSEELAGHVAYHASTHAGRGDRLRALFQAIRWPNA